MRRWLKVIRDMQATWGRSAFMMFALAVGLISFGTVLSTSEVLKREMNRAYLASTPASAIFDVGEQGIHDDILDRLRQNENVGRVARRTTRKTRWRKPGADKWNPALLFVLEDYSNNQVATLGHEMGAKTPTIGTVLVERSAMKVLGARLGDPIILTTTSGTPRELTITGIVHEPALAPAATEQSGYFYVSAETLSLLGESNHFDEIRVLVADNPLNAAAVDTQVKELAHWLQSEGVTLHNVRVPPPGRHPHQRSSNAVLILFTIFSVLTVFLAGVLTATLLSIVMARQRKEIAVMKTLGATSSMLRWQYVVMLLGISMGALLLSAIPTLLLKTLAIQALATMMNFDIQSTQVPFWVWGVQIAVGVSVPLLVALPSITRSSRKKVIGVMGDYGARATQGSIPIMSRLSNRIFLAAIRNAFRVPRRLFLSIALLAVGGGLFIASISISDSWQESTELVYQTRHYDVEVHLKEEVTQDAVHELEKTATVVERVGFAPVTVANNSGLSLSRTYPDGGHNSFTMVAVSENNSLLEFPLQSGRWLDPNVAKGVVLNQMAAAQISAALGAKTILGTEVSLLVHGVLARWTVVGIVNEVAASATAYVSHAAFEQHTQERVRGLRIRFSKEHRQVASSAMLVGVEDTLARLNFHVEETIPLELIYNAMGEHVAILIQTLLVLALLMVVVGGLALASMTSISVVERNREWGVMRAIGASSGQVTKMILTEGVCVAILSLPFAVLIAVLVATLIGQWVGRLAFLLPLPLNLSWVSLLLWSIGIVLISVVSAIIPARSAMRQSVTNSLAHV